MKKIIFILLAVLIMIPVTTLAVDLVPETVTGNDKYTLLEPLPCINGSEGCKTGETRPDITLNDYIGYVYKFAIALATFLAIVMITWGGFEYMTSDSISSKSNAKAKFTNAATGLLMVLASYLILRTIDPRLVEINTSLPQIKIDTSDVNNFETNLVTDIKNLSIQDQQQINDNIKKINELKAQLDETTSEEDYYSIQDQIDKIEAENIRLKASREGSASFTSVYDSLHDPQAGVDNVTNRDNTIKAMGSYYDAQISKSTDPNTIQTLQRQKQFYLSQIKEETDLVTLAKSYIGSSEKTWLADKQAEYKAELTNQTKIVGTGIPSSEYTTILNTRISYIDTLLKPKK